jgi:hypothetical protein
MGTVIGLTIVALYVTGVVIYIYYLLDKKYDIRLAEVERYVKILKGALTFKDKPLVNEPVDISKPTNEFKKESDPSLIDIMANEKAIRSLKKKNKYYGKRNLNKA